MSGPAAQDISGKPGAPVPAAASGLPDSLRIQDQLASLAESRTAELRPLLDTNDDRRW